MKTKTSCSGPVLPPPSSLTIHNHSPPASASSFSVLNPKAARRLRIALLALLSLAILLPAIPVSAATITVNSNCSLADAITAANSDSATGGCPAGSGQDTINLPSGGRTTLTADLPDITSELTINGNGHVISGNDQRRIFKIAIGGFKTVGIIGLTMTDGNAGNGAGGAILLESGMLELNGVTIRGSRAARGGGIGNDATVNGSSVTIENSTISGNTASEHGGGIYAVGIAQSSITYSAVFNNRVTGAGGKGGGLYYTGIGFTIQNSTFYGNRASQGGAVFFRGSEGFSLVQATFTRNTATATDGGGGLRHESTGDVIIEHVLLAGNTNGDCTQSANANYASGRFKESLVRTGNCNSNGINIITGDPRLEASPRGRPPYFRLLAGSAALDVGPCPTAYGDTDDQRGVQRPVGGACDYGAWEGRGVESGSGNGSSSSGKARVVPRVPMARTCMDLMLTGIVVMNRSAGTACQRVDAAGIGIASVVEAGFIDAVDVWGWITPNTQVCFTRSGGAFRFLDAATSPRAVSSLAAFSNGGMVCTTIDSAGTVVLVSPGAPAMETAPETEAEPEAAMAQEAEPAVAPASAAEEAARSLEGCMVTTNYNLNFRATPGGEILDKVPYYTMLPARERTGQWFLVFWAGRWGWVSAGHVVAHDHCG